MEKPEVGPAVARSSGTRQRLLEAAGEVFAEQGFQGATIQEICSRAGANVAAVNYHFRDKEQLYLAVIEYAGLCARESHVIDTPPEASAAERLRAHIESFLLHLLAEGRPAWHGKLMAREMFEPTSALDAIVAQHIRENQAQLHAILRDLLGPDCPEASLRKCAFSIVGQCLFYHHCQPVIRRLYPALPIDGDQVPELAEHIFRFSLAGIRAAVESSNPGKRS
jgi:AcrR family transcriptional regulator